MYIAIATGYAIGMYISSFIPTPQSDESNKLLLERLKESQGESAIVQILEGYMEEGWSPVEMNLYIPPARE